ncbi:hypothetical protein LJC58_04290, partial [Lachnospiraceae bacterium OttesenSCG-928-D06]|nr:hypothetical protein [Lachnospiraceae bacterium OttesenSCG-928-D06]
MKIKGSNFPLDMGKIIKVLFFLGGTVQILLALVWMCSNLSAFQEFTESSSPLYCVIVKLAKSIGKIPGIEWYMYIYLLQLFIGFYAYYSFLSLLMKAQIEQKFYVYWGSFCLISIPIVIQ